MYVIEEGILKILPPSTENVYYRNRMNEFATYVGFDSKNKLSMTRGVGDYDYEDKIGFICVPSVKKIPDISNNQIVIAATDGFWDSWTHLEVLEFLKKGQFDSLEGEHIKKSDFYFGEDKDDTLLFLIKNWK